MRGLTRQAVTKIQNKAYSVGRQADRPFFSILVPKVCQNFGKVLENGASKVRTN